MRTDTCFFEIVIRYTDLYSDQRTSSAVRGADDFPDSVITAGYETVGTRELRRITKNGHPLQ